MGNIHDLNHYLVGPHAHRDAGPHPSGPQPEPATSPLDTREGGLQIVPIIHFQTIFLVLKGRELIFCKLLCTDLLI